MHKNHTTITNVPGLQNKGPSIKDVHKFPACFHSPSPCPLLPNPSPCGCPLLCLQCLRCWLGSRKGIRPVKIWVVGYWRGYVSGSRCRCAYGPADATATHYLLIQIGFTFLVLAHLGGPGKIQEGHKMVKWLCMCSGCPLYMVTHQHSSRHQIPVLIVCTASTR